MTVPNLLTSLRIALIPLLIALLYAGVNIWSAVLFILLSLTDALDGYIARKTGTVTEFGKLWDPIADKLLVLSALIMLVGQGAAPALPVLIITAREIVISGWRGSRETVVPASAWGKFKTVAQLIAVPMLILKVPCAVPALWIAAILSVYSGAEYIGRR